jgi:hypothetical protein
MVLIGEEFEPQVITAARWLRKFGISVRCIEVRVTTDDAQPKSLYMNFDQVFPSSYDDSIFPSAGEVLPKEFEQLLSELRIFTATRSRLVAEPSSGSQSSKERATAIERDSPKTWEEFLSQLENPFLVEFVKKWEETGERILPESDYRLVFPRKGERWRIQARKDHAWVMQHGRFEIGAESDETFWKRLLDERANVRVLRNGTRPYFDLWTKRDFDAFWLAITETLRDVPFSVK